MGIEFEDLPHWEFTVVEFSPGSYRIKAVRDGGVRGEGTGTDPDSLLDEFKQWAHNVEKDVATKTHSVRDKTPQEGVNRQQKA